MGFRRAVIVLAVLATLAPPAGAAPLGREAKADVRRFLTVLAGIRDEYQEAVDEEGRVVRPVEIEEAKLLVADGRDLLRRIGAVVPEDAPATLDRLDALLGSGGAAETLAGVADDLRARVSAATGVSDSMPHEAPSAARGAALFAENCAGCHGATGAGDGPEAATLGVKPANFSDPEFMRAETPQDFFNVISLGRRRTGMPAWDESLGVQARWDLVAHLWTLTGRPVAAGMDAYRTACSSCHGGALEGGPGVPGLADPLVLARRSEDDLVGVLGAGVHAEQPAVAALSEESRRRIAAWVQHAALSSTPAEPGEPESGTMSLRGLEESVRLLGESLEVAGRGDSRASELATEAYIAFEPFEPSLRVRRADLVDRVEESFVAYRLALRSGADAPRLAELAAAAEAALDGATQALRNSTAPSWGAAFGQSIAIVVREGVEIILIVGALLTWVRRRGSAELARVIHAGVAAGALASLATALLIVTVLGRLPWATEAIEGGAMLVASVVLFWVSYWLVSKAEADRWQRFIRDRVESAIGRGSRLGLASAAFLAVYREGFETVLFYQALVASGGGAGPVTAGFATGAVLLAVIYAVMRWLGMHIPIRPFFLVTGVLLYGLSIVFAGRGVAELQEAGLVAMTPVAFVPTIPALGLFPTVETLLAQGILVGLLALAVLVTLRRRPREAAATIALVLAVIALPGADARSAPGAARPVGEAREWLMGTIAEVRIFAIDRPERTAAAIEAVFDELRTVDRLMAVQRPESDVSRMNREAAAGPVAVDRRVVEVLRASRDVSRLTDGAFDVTVLPVVAAWGFLDGPARRPSAPPPRPAGWDRVELDAARGLVRYATSGVGIDLGGIAKGYALDRARGVLLGHGVRAAWLDLGGNVATLGIPPDAPGWRIAIRHPRRDGDVLGVLEVGEASVSTSSDAERFVDDEQGRAGHVIDPRTGAPAGALVAATVVTASATLADALSTAAIVVGAERIEDVLDRVHGEAVLVRSVGADAVDLAVTPGLAFEPRSGS